ncbi:MAG: hypothetical protein D6740_02130 [Alphaproteobacteria bacterium]|nr:MAG: hypothetical protein D6740_02130 [Alphaproteobacteria bacterium]
MKRAVVHDERAPPPFFGLLKEGRIGRFPLPGGSGLNPPFPASRFRILPDHACPAPIFRFLGGILLAQPSSTA